MIQVLKTKYCFWRNIYALRPVLAAELRLGEMFGWTTAQLGAPLAKLLHERWPEMKSACEPIDAAQFVAELAQSLQCMVDVTLRNCGVHARDSDKKTATVFFSCMDNFLAEGTLRAAVQVAIRLGAPSFSVDQLVEILNQCDYHVHRAGLDQSTRAMVEKGQERDIPWFRLSGMSRHVQFGQGAKQQHIFETLTAAESPIARDLTCDKLMTFQVLSQLHLPVGRFAGFADMAGAMRAAEAIGYPLVLKPTAGKKGIGVYANLRNAEELKIALAKISSGEQFVLQSFFPGEDHRILIVGGKFIHGASRLAASVTGDGQHTIAELVKIANRDPRRGAGFNKIMNFIEIDGETERVLGQQGLALESVPKEGEQVRLKSAANISQGGTAVDVTNIIHPDNARAAIKAAMALGLTVAGVDFISPDISKSWREVGGGICEVNAVVGLRAHQIADPKADVIGPILETIYPKGENGRIPTAMITGTKGKSTTAFMLRKILACAGHTVGAVTTDGVTVGDEEVAVGDYAGVTGAAIALRDPTVTAAVLETARGGLLKSGIYLDWCDAAALVNLGREQIGIDGIETVEEMAALKRKVLNTAKKAVVLNAEDAHCAAMVPEFASSIRTILFSMDANAPLVREHVADGGEAVVLNSAGGQEIISIESKSASLPLMAAAELPSTMNGLIRANIANALSAAALAIALNIPPEHIREGLRHYENVHGRFSFINGFPMKIMFDRAAQAPAYAMVLPVTDAIPIKGKRICAITVAGNRPDWMFNEAMVLLAGHFDRYICFEFEEYRRGRKPGEIAAMLSSELQKAGVTAACISAAGSNLSAARVVASEAAPDDFVVVLGMGAHSIDEYRAAFREAGR